MLNSSSEMLSFLPRWDCFWKCEFDTDVNIEKVHIKTQSKKLYITRDEGFRFTAFDKTCTQENVKCQIQHDDSWLRWIVIEQVNYKEYYFRWKKLYSHTFKTSLDEVIVMYSEKMNAKYMKEDVWKCFFFVNLQAGISQLHYRLTSSQIAFRDFKYLLRF